MERYGNLDGDSGVVAYALLPDRIRVKFRNGAVYEYGPLRPGRRKVDTMKRLARSGRGLSTFISRHVRDDYERIVE